MKNTKEEVKALRDEIRKIKGWRNEMALMRPDEVQNHRKICDFSMILELRDYNETKVSSLLKMHERLGRALAWEAI